jgi:hypothetical protein
METYLCDNRFALVIKKSVVPSMLEADLIDMRPHKSGERDVKILGKTNVKDVIKQAVLLCREKRCHVNYEDFNLE